MTSSLRIPEAMQQNQQPADDVEEGPPKPKRRIVSADDNIREIPNTKQPKVSLEERQNLIVHKFLCACYCSIGRAAGFEEKEHLSNIYLATHIMMVLKAAHTILRKTENEREGMEEYCNKVITLRHMTVTRQIKMMDAITVVDHWAKQYGLSYPEPMITFRNDWWSTAGSIILYSTIYYHRQTELRIGHGLMPVVMRGGIESSISVKNYGIWPHHNILLQGITFPRMDKSVMVQYLGPGTQLIKLIRYGNNEYSGKWKQAVLRTFAEVHNIQKIVEYLPGKTTSELGSIPNLLLTLATLKDVRSVMRASFPFNMVVLHCCSAPEIDHFLKVPLPNHIYEPVHPFHIDYSENFMYDVYHGSMDHHLTFPAVFTAEEAGQIIFHSIFGTYCEDLGVLAKVTNVKKWYTRAEIRNKFKDLGTCTTLVTPILPRFLYFSKLSPVTPTVLTGSEVRRVSIFAGYRTQYIDEPFLEINKTSIEKSLNNQLEYVSDLIRSNIYSPETVPVSWLPIEQKTRYYNKEINLAGRVFAGNGTYWLKNRLEND